MSEMKLSEAIRLGAMATEQGFGPDSVLSDTAPCALGAARMAAGITCDLNHLVYLAINEKWPGMWKVVPHPVTGGAGEFASIIWQLNDRHQWSRERIADWVETVERRAEAESVSTQQETAPTTVSFAQKA